MEGHNSFHHTPSRSSTAPISDKATNPSSIPNPPARDKTQEKRNALRKGAWALDEASFRQHFGDDAYESCGFLEGLIGLSKIQPSFSIVWPLLEEAYSKRRAAKTQLSGDPSHLSWSRRDINQVMDAMAAQMTAPGNSLDAGLILPEQLASCGREDETSNDQQTYTSGIIPEASTSRPPSQAPSRGTLDKTDPADSNPSKSTVSIPPTPERRSMRTAAKRPSSTLSLQKTLTDKVVDIEDKDRQEFASNLIKIFTNKTKEDIKSGAFNPPAGMSADGFGLKLGLAVEFAVYLKYWGTEARASAQYEAKIQRVLENVSTNPQLRHQILTGAISLKQLSETLNEDRATNERVTAIPKNRAHHAEKAKQDQSGKTHDYILQPSPKDARKRAQLEGKKKSHQKDPTEIYGDVVEEIVTKNHSNNRKSVITQGRKRSRSTNTADVGEDDDDSHEQILTSKVKDDSKRIQELNKIMEAYIQPNPEDVPINYLDTCLLLPPDAPLSWPHLIDVSTLSKSDTTGLHIADMVVTVLYNHSPASLSRFMDMSHGFTFHVKEAPASKDQDILIIRTGMTVTCGFVDEGGKKWSVKHKYGLRATPMARWTPLRFEEYKGDGLEECVVVDDVVKVMAAGEALAFKILEAKVWVPSEGARIHVRNSAAWRS